MASLVAQLIKNPPAVQETWVWTLGQEDPLEKEMETHSSILAWEISLTEEPGGLQPTIHSQESDKTKQLNQITIARKIEWLITLVQSRPKWLKGVLCFGLISVFCFMASHQVYPCSSSTWVSGVMQHWCISKLNYDSGPSSTCVLCFVLKIDRRICPSIS